MNGGLFVTQPLKSSPLRQEFVLPFAICHLWLGLLTLCAPALADTLIATNDERFVGVILEETTNTIIFQSDLAGKITLPRASIREIQRSPRVQQSPAPSTPSPSVPLSTLNSPLSTNFWVPPVVGHDKSDWLQLKSGEWLRGRLKYVQNRKVEFDSDELEEQTFKLKDVRQLYPAEPMYAKFNDREPAFGTIVISNRQVSISGPEQLTLSDDELTGITPSGERGMRDWSGNFSAGLSLQSGNRQVTTVTTRGELARRTPATALVLDYLGNYSDVDGSKVTDNQRVNLSYDIRLDRHWFIRPAQFEYYRDSVANISYRLTGGTGAGYYFFDNDTLTWRISAGPGYVYTRFDTVESGENESASTAAGIFQSYFKLDITRRLTFTQSFTSTVTSREAGQYTHHAVTLLEFEIKHHLDLDVSFIWDYLHNPQVESDGTTPEKSDYYLTVGFGVRF